MFARERAEEEARRLRQITKQRVATSKTRDEFDKQERKDLPYRRKTMVRMNSRRRRELHRKRVTLSLQRLFPFRAIAAAISSPFLNSPSNRINESPGHRTLDDVHHPRILCNSI